jgi:hypothetical protein
MRMMMTAALETGTANEGIRTGKLQTAIQQILDEVKPEAAYFTTDDAGCRFAVIVFDMKNSSEMPALAEPWFQGFNAKVTFRPAMTPQDLAAAGPALAKFAEKK